MSDPLARPPLELVRAMPKVCLHEHLDGSLRPSTVLDLARHVGYRELPQQEAEELGQWFFSGANRQDLGLYLEGFRHTIAVMQSERALERVAYECLEDAAAENVVYQEVRFAPHFHTRAGLGLDEVMLAVLRGLRRASHQHGIGFGLIVCALRNESPELSMQLVELALAFREQGCVGFDLAGEEAGYPAKDHLRAFQLAKRMNFSITIHAGESFGPESIWQALQYCGAHRIGHGTRLSEDIDKSDSRIAKIGPLAQYVVDHRIPLEVCISSNVHTGATATLASHPFPAFHALGFRLTLNTDNRLMSRTDLSTEYHLAVETFGLGFDDLETLSINGMKSAFAHYDTRCRVIYERIKRGFNQLRETHGFPPRKRYGVRD